MPGRLGVMTTGVVVGWVVCGQARAEEVICGADMDCPPWAICTTSVGECGSAKAPLEVCTGRCAAGQAWRLVPRLEATAGLPLRQRTGAAVGVEIVPPVLEGHLSFFAEWWTQEFGRIGAAGTIYPVDALGLSIRADAVPWRGGLQASIGGRVDFFPWAVMPSLTMNHYFSVSASGGVFVLPVDERFARRDAIPWFVTLGIGFWLPAL